MISLFRIIILSFSFSVYSIEMLSNEENCDSLSISNALSSLHLNPSITKNGDFFAAILNEYASTVSDDLLKNHPVLMKKPNGLIDMKTIEWFILSYSKSDITDNTKATKFFLSPFMTIDNQFGADSMIRTAVGESFPHLMYVPAFLSIEQLNAMKNSYKQNNYQTPTNYFVLFYKLERNVAQKMAEVLFEFISDSNVKLHYSEVVDTIIKSSIPSHIQLELPHCFGTCGESLGEGEKLDKTEDEILEIFKNGKMDQFFGPIENSYSYKFASMIYASWSGYDNNIISYYGSVGFLESAAWVRDINNPKNLIKYTVPFVSWLDKNGKSVNLDKNEFRYIHKRSHFKK